MLLFQCYTFANTTSIKLLKPHPICVKLGLHDADMCACMCHGGCLQLGVAVFVRTNLVIIGCLAQLTYNLPPLDTAIQCWRAVRKLLRWVWRAWGVCGAHVRLPVCDGCLYRKQPWQP
jgi:hypothetical protein